MSLKRKLLEKKGAKGFKEIEKSLQEERVRRSRLETDVRQLKEQMQTLALSVKSAK